MNRPSGGNPHRTSRSILPLIFAAIAIIAPSAAAAQRVQAPRIKFSGYDWDLRVTTKPEGPQDNQFAGLGKSVRILDNGSLELSISYEGGAHYAGEVTLRRSLGYGTYIFRLATPPAGLDPNLVLGFFTYSSQSSYAHREIDVEFSAWGVQKEPVLGQFVVQPYQDKGHLASFSLDGIGIESSYAFTWTESKVDFVAWRGSGAVPAAGDTRIISAWSFTDQPSVPRKGNERVHINLYLAKGGIPPAGTGLTSVEITGFSFLPVPR